MDTRGPEASRWPRPKQIVLFSASGWRAAQSNYNNCTTSGPSLFNRPGASDFKRRSQHERTPPVTGSSNCTDANSVAARKSVPLEH